MRELVCVWRECGREVALDGCLLEGGHALLLVGCLRGLLLAALDVVVVLLGREDG